MKICILFSQTRLSRCRVETLHEKVGPLLSTASPSMGTRMAEPANRSEEKPKLHQPIALHSLSNAATEQHGCGPSERANRQKTVQLWSIVLCPSQIRRNRAVLSALGRFGVFELSRNPNPPPHTPRRMCDVHGFLSCMGAYV